MREAAAARKSTHIILRAPRDALRWASAVMPRAAPGPAPRRRPVAGRLSDYWARPAPLDRRNGPNSAVMGNDISSAISPAGRRDLTHHLHPYTQLRQLEQEGPLVIVRGDGVRVFDEHGREYIEGMAGLWCASLGFSEKRLAEAAYRQMQALPYHHPVSGK